MHNVCGRFPSGCGSLSLVSHFGRLRSSECFDHFKY